MSDDHNVSTSPAKGEPSHSRTSPASRAASSIADRASEAGTAVWETTRDTGRQAYDVGRQALREDGDYGLIAFVAGAALGYAVAYSIYARSGSEHREGVADHVIDILNDLIAISYDGEDGFRTSAAGVKSAELKRIFNAAADRCARGARELQRKVRQFGGEPHEGGSVTGALHRRWVDLKSRITSMDDAAILDEVERGEDVAKAAYDKALRSSLPHDVRSMLQRQYRGVRENHDRTRELRDAARQSTSTATR